MGGWLVSNALAKLGAAEVSALRQRVAVGLATTFASHYTRRISLRELLDVADRYNLPVLAPEAAARFFGAGQSWITQHFSWFYVLVAGLFPILLLWLAFSEYGRIRLSPDDARPEFSFASHARCWRNPSSVSKDCNGSAGTLFASQSRTSARKAFCLSV